MDILKEEGAAQVGGVLHCFTESLEMAQAAMEMGFYISVSGIATFKSAKDLQAVIKEIPLDRLLVETDSPYLAPVPHRGEQNQPAYTRNVAEFVANLKGVSIEELERVTTENFFKLFNKPWYKSCSELLDRKKMQGKKCLDLCCGNGEFAHILRERHRMEVTCADYIPFHLQHK